MALAAGPMEPRDMAVPSTPVIGRAVFGMKLLDPFYPIVDSAAWSSAWCRSASGWCSCASRTRPEAGLRAADPPAKALVRGARRQLVVNDHWRLAIEEGCDFVHLGQEDLAPADLRAIRAAGLRLGSQHAMTDAELDRRWPSRPDYVALGPIYPTTLKPMPWAPQGLERMAVEEPVAPLPLVAIGGLIPERLGRVRRRRRQRRRGHRHHERDPEARTRAWIEV